ncbi:HD domain-containing protein [Desulfonatronum thiodismutans]|uniref:HD domain-containing protein n=1 Tax=Desulfonatronum thiodismutans TaxID=159290 RepID=UPI00068F3A04|nr:HD domain-containing protein [Desulfonatronum thiodismutans]
MSKLTHEFRDPVHVFIRMDPDERSVVDSEPFQRLRHIHQLAMTYQVYPGATHRRFEHSLGCMEIATRIFDSITRTEKLRKLPLEVRERIPELDHEDKLSHWRKTLRLAALCHDLGHLPFSHASEELLPEGIDHEILTMRLVLEEMKDLWFKMNPAPKPEQIAKIAVGKKKAKHMEFTPWETILSEIITGDVFGADRMDYLLRDSLHAGVSYGHFDHHRLIDTMMILAGPPQDDSQKYSIEPALGIESGGVQVAESLLVARYLMFTQVYFHHVRRIYDVHLKRFLKESLLGGTYPVDLKQFLAITDNEISSQILLAAKDKKRAGHEHAKSIATRKHYRKIYQLMVQDRDCAPDVLERIAKGLADEIGSENIIIDSPHKNMASKDDFPIRTEDGRIMSAHGESKVMTSLPVAATGFIFVHPDSRDRACKWREKFVGNYFQTRDEQP